jgi:2,4-diaminopentanoate dehydrogenase
VTYRVIQWATGTTGSHAVRAIATHPELELVGALVYSEDKAGRDVGELVGIGPIGVTATTDQGEILARDADCVVHMGQLALDSRPHLDDICRILASGKNVVTTVLTDLIYPVVMGPEVVERLEAACKAGGVSFHGTGIAPGWASEVLPLVLSGLWKRVERVTVREILDYATYPSRVTIFDLMGFGHPPDRPSMIQLGIGAGKIFDAPLRGRRRAGRRA